jgi:hypothetical protein
MFLPPVVSYETAPENATLGDSIETTPKTIVKKPAGKPGNRIGKSERQPEKTK